jgi:cytochrome P450
LRTIFTVDPENIKAILTTQFTDYGKGESFHREWKEFLGDSIFATDGEQWSRSRQLIRPMFARERIVDTEMFEKHIVKLVSLMGGNGNAKGGYPDGNRVVDVGPLFFRYTMDVATDHLLGKGVDSLDNPTSRFAEAFRYVLDRQAVIFRAGYVSISFTPKPKPFLLTIGEDIEKMHMIKAPSNTSNPTVPSVVLFLARSSDRSLRH